MKDFGNKGIMGTIATVIVIIFQIFKKAEENVSMLRGNLEDIKMTQVKISERKKTRIGRDHM